MVFGAVKAKLSQCESLAMAEVGIRKEEVIHGFTQFNFSFMHFPRQVFVGIFHINSVCISNKIMPKA